MNCQDFQECLFDYVDGTLPTGVHAETDAHLAACEQCRKTLAQHGQLARHLSAQLRQSAQSLPLAPEARNRLVAALLDPAAKTARRRVPEFSKPISRVRSVLINTPLQRGVAWWRELGNRFNGFLHTPETVETVSAHLPTLDTPLKRGVNARGQHLHGYETSVRNAGWSRLIVKPLAGVFSPAVRRWALAGCLLAGVALIGGLWFGTHGPGLSSAAAAQPTVIVSATVPQIVTTYTFHQEGQFVTDVLTIRAETVHETFRAEHASNASLKTPVNKMSL